jgi:nucleoside-diphosphate-sugar epimerase
VYGADCSGNCRLLLQLVHRLPVVYLGGQRQLRGLIYVDNLCCSMVLSELNPAAAGKTFPLSDGAFARVAQLAVGLCPGSGKNVGSVAAVPELRLRLLATAAKRRDATYILAARLVVEASPFMAASGWQPPLPPARGPVQTASEYLVLQAA